MPIIFFIYPQFCESLKQYEYVLLATIVEQSTIILCFINFFSIERIFLNCIKVSQNCQEYFLTYKLIIKKWRIERYFKKTLLNTFCVRNPKIYSRSHFCVTPSICSYQLPKAHDLSSYVASTLSHFLLKVSFLLSPETTT